MPTDNSNVKFMAGPWNSFPVNSADNNTVYFITDQQRIFVGNTEYAPPVDWGVVYPINSIIMFYDNEDHSSHLGLEWSRCLQGNVPVGIDSSDSDFNTIGNTLGEKQHVLSSTEVPTLNFISVTSGLLGRSDDVVSGYDSSGQPYSNLQPSEVVSFWRRIQ